MKHTIFQKMLNKQIKGMNKRLIYIVNLNIDNNKLIQRVHSFTSNNIVK